MMFCFVKEESVPTRFIQLNYFYRIALFEVEKLIPLKSYAKQFCGWYKSVQISYSAYPQIFKKDIYP